MRECKFNGAKSLHSILITEKMIWWQTWSVSKSPKFIKRLWSAQRPRRQRCKQSRAFGALHSQLIEVRHQLPSFTAIYSCHTDVHEITNCSFITDHLQRLSAELGDEAPRHRRDRSEQTPQHQHQCSHADADTKNLHKTDDWTLILTCQLVSLSAFTLRCRY